MFLSLKTYHQTSKSKARRTKANARERNRMHQLNDAFDHLRKHVPFYKPGNLARSPSNLAQSKLSKIETIRLALNYIQTLGMLLESGSTIDHSELWSRLVQRISQPTAIMLKTQMQLDSNLKLIVCDDLDFCQVQVDK